MMVSIARPRRRVLNTDGSGMDMIFFRLMFMKDPRTKSFFRKTSTFSLIHVSLSFMVSPSLRNSFLRLNMMASAYSRLALGQLDFFTL